jgi:hypothetical protein
MFHMKVLYYHNGSFKSIVRVFITHVSITKFVRDLKLTNIYVRDLKLTLFHKRNHALITLIRSI